MKKFDASGMDMHEMHWNGLTVISSITRNDPDHVQKWPFILNGYYDDVLAVAFYYTAHAELPESVEKAHADAGAIRGIENTKTHLRNRMQAILDPVGFSKAQRAREKELERDFYARMDREDRARRRNYRMGREEEERKEKQKRDSFNSQHKPAPEGTVKELATKYGKSIGEIRKLKAAGELHTLVTP